RDTFGEPSQRVKVCNERASVRVLDIGPVKDVARSESGVEPPNTLRFELRPDLFSRPDRGAGVVAANPRVPVCRSHKQRSKSGLTLEFDAIVRTLSGIVRRKRLSELDKGKRATPFDACSAGRALNGPNGLYLNFLNFLTIDV